MLLELELETIQGDMAALNQRVVDVVGRLKSIRKKEADREDAEHEPVQLPRAS